MIPRRFSLKHPSVFLKELSVSVVLPSVFVEVVTLSVNTTQAACAMTGGSSRIEILLPLHGVTE